jgi:hypothetical protein
MATDMHAARAQCHGTGRKSEVYKSLNACPAKHLARSLFPAGLHALAPLHHVGNHVANSTMPCLSAAQAAMHR